MLLVILGKTSNFDHLVYNTVISFRNSVLDCYFITITKLANTLTIIFVVIFFALIFRNRHSLLSSLFHANPPSNRHRFHLHRIY